jgi:hypothetical protein
MKRKKLTILGLAAIVLAIIGALTIPSAQATNGFTGEQFLEWERQSQDALIQNSIVMIAIVATQGHEEIARCIDRWYSSDNADRTQIHRNVIEAIAKNKTHNPQGVILVYVQRECGRFKDAH